MPETITAKEREPDKQKGESGRSHVDVGYEVERSVSLVSRLRPLGGSWQIHQHKRRKPVRKDRPGLHIQSLRCL